MSNLSWGAGNAKPCWALCPRAGCCSQPLHPVWSCLSSILQASSGILRPFLMISTSPIIISPPWASLPCSGLSCPTQSMDPLWSAGSGWAWVQSSLGWFFCFATCSSLFLPNSCIRLHRFQMDLILPASVFVPLGCAVCRFNWSILFCSFSQAPHATKFRMDHFSLCFKVCGV